MAARARVCVIGAGSSGIAACQVLHARGIAFDCFEKGSQVGGNWRYRNDNAMSAAYESLSINTSRRVMQYAAYPMPGDYPDFPSHRQIAAYFDAYVDHFGFRGEIEFGVEVTRVEQAGGGWSVSLDSGRTREYEAVLVANGHHWDARWPEPAYPGDFDGQQIHSHDYRTPEDYEGSRTMVVGLGNSACDIAVEVGGVAEQVFQSVRRGEWVMPKYVGSRPTDDTLPEAIRELVPMRALAPLLEATVRATNGHPRSFGLPAPDHRIHQAHPTISADLPDAVRSGRVAIRPGIESLEPGGVRFLDGSTERVDRIVWCTGYRISFPFLDPQLLDPSGDNRIELYHRVVHPGLRGLYFIGLIQPLYAIMPLAELQSQWVADLLEGSVTLPGEAEMRASIAADRRALDSRYVASKRHTIQVDGPPYRRRLQRERRRRRRGAQGAAARLRGVVRGG